MDDVTAKVLAMDSAERGELEQALYEAWEVNDAAPAPTDVAIRRISMCAPEALRLLLAGEWADNSDGEYFPRCPWCHNREDYPPVMGDGCYSEPDKHSPACPWLGLMQKVGLR